MGKTLTAEQLKILAFVKVCVSTHPGYLSRVSRIPYRDILAILKVLVEEGRIEARGKGYIVVSRTC